MKDKNDTPPIRTELSVLDADDPVNEVGFTVREYIGVEVLLAPPGLTYDEVRKTVNWPEGFKPKPLMQREDVWEGGLVIIPNLFGGLSVYKVETMEDGSFCGRSGSMIAFLEFSKDERECWVCYGTGNLDAIRKLDLYKEE